MFCSEDTHTHTSCVHIYCVWLESNLYAIAIFFLPSLLLHSSLYSCVRTRMISLECWRNKYTYIHIYKVYVMTLDNLIFQVNAAQCECVGTKWKCCNLEQQQRRQNISDFYFIIHTVNGCFLFRFLALFWKGVFRNFPATFCAVCGKHSANEIGQSKNNKIRLAPLDLLFGVTPRYIGGYAIKSIKENPKVCRVLIMDDLTHPAITFHIFTLVSASLLARLALCTVFSMRT